MPTDHSMATHAERKSWLNDPLDILTLIDAIKNEREFIALKNKQLFSITDAGYSPLDRTEPLYRVEPADKSQFVPMGFYTLKYLQLQLEKM